MKRYVLLGFLLLVTITMAFAAPLSPTSLTVLSSGSRQFATVSNANVSAQGGNVTELTIDALTVTKSWQGYYGNVTGNIHLDDGNNMSFYVWGNSTTMNGEVYASRSSAPDWTTINCTNDTQRSLEETYLGLSATDGDSVLNTFNHTSHPAFFVGTRPILSDSCYSTNINVNESSQNSSFHQILLSDVDNNTVYTTIIEPHAYGYNYNQMDFQLMVGENEHQGNEGVTPYFFFTELN